jgi:hypothetical protein
MEEKEGASPKPTIKYKKKHANASLDKRDATNVSSDIVSHLSPIIVPSKSLSTLEPSLLEDDPVLSSIKRKASVRVIFQRARFVDSVGSNSFFRCVLRYEGYDALASPRKNNANCNRLRKELVDRLLMVCFGYAREKAESVLSDIRARTTYIFDDERFLDQRRHAALRSLTKAFSKSNLVDNKKLQSSCLVDQILTTPSVETEKTTVPEVVPESGSVTRSDFWGRFIHPKESPLGIANLNVGNFYSTKIYEILKAKSFHSHSNNEFDPEIKYGDKMHLVFALEYILDSYLPDQVLDLDLLCSFYSECRGTTIVLYNNDDNVTTDRPFKIYRPKETHPDVGCYLYLARAGRNRNEVELLEPVDSPTEVTLVTLADIRSEVRFGDVLGRTAATVRTTNPSPFFPSNFEPQRRQNKSSKRLTELREPEKILSNFQKAPSLPETATPYDSLASEKDITKKIAPEEADDGALDAAESLESDASAEALDTKKIETNIDLAPRRPLSQPESKFSVPWSLDNFFFMEALLMARKVNLNLNVARKSNANKGKFRNNGEEDEKNDVNEKADEATDEGSKVSLSISSSVSSSASLFAKATAALSPSKLWDNVAGMVGKSVGAMMDERPLVRYVIKHAAPVSSKMHDGKSKNQQQQPHRHDDQNSGWGLASKSKLKNEISRLNGTESLEARGRYRKRLTLAVAKGLFDYLWVVPRKNLEDLQKSGSDRAERYLKTGSFKALGDFAPDSMNSVLRGPCVFPHHLKDGDYKFYPYLCYEPDDEPLNVSFVSHLDGSRFAGNCAGHIIFNRSMKNHLLGEALKLFTFTGTNANVGSSPVSSVGSRVAQCCLIPGTGISLANMFSDYVVKDAGKFGLDFEEDEDEEMKKRTKTTLDSKGKDKSNIEDNESNDDSSSEPIAPCSSPSNPTVGFEAPSDFHNFSVPPEIKEALVNLMCLENTCVYAFPLGQVAVDHSVEIDPLKSPPLSQTDVDAQFDRSSWVKSKDPHGDIRIRIACEDYEVHDNVPLINLSVQIPAEAIGIAFHCIKPYVKLNKSVIRSPTSLTKISKVHEEGGHIWNQDRDLKDRSSKDALMKLIAGDEHDAFNWKPAAFVPKAAMGLDFGILSSATDLKEAILPENRHQTNSKEEKEENHQGISVDFADAKVVGFKRNGTNCPLFISIKGMPSEGLGVMPGGSLSPLELISGTAASMSTATAVVPTTSTTTMTTTTTATTTITTTATTTTTTNAAITTAETRLQSRSGLISPVIFGEKDMLYIIYTVLPASKPDSRLKNGTYFRKVEEAYSRKMFTRN